jgi:hypothetical protein
MMRKSGATTDELGLLTETHEEVRNVHHVRRISSGTVIHFVLFSRLVLDYVQENIDRRVAVLRSRAVPFPGEHQG